MIDNLGNRMKGYEAVASRTFIKRMPVIIRLDGKAFHTFTRPLKRKKETGDDPFSLELHTLMKDTMFYLCENIQNAVFAYTQSDEISILLNDWKEFETQQWFGGTQSKIESISASLATAYFNYRLRDSGLPEECIKQLALFDSRAYNVPKEDVTNYFIWRQKDAIRNSVNMLGQHYFSPKKMHGRNVQDVKKMLLDIGMDWEQLEDWKKQGTIWYKHLDQDALAFYGPAKSFMQNRDLIDNQLKP